jgi:hypothetical protein
MTNCKIKLTCETCKAEYSAWPCEVRNGRRFCSLKCREYKRWENQTPEERFWKAVDKKNGTVPQHCPELGRCWIFIGGKNLSGYGQFSFQGQPMLAHRFSWQLTCGKPSDCVLHQCDNPACVRPSHLFEGTRKDNAHDCILKNRFPFRPKGLPRDTKLKPFPW